MCLRDIRNVPTYHTASRSLAPQAQLDGLRLGLQVLLPCGGLGVSHLSKDRLHRFGVLEVLLPFPIEVLTAKDPNSTPQSVGHLEVESTDHYEGISVS